MALEEIVVRARRVDVRPRGGIDRPGARGGASAGREKRETLEEIIVTASAAAVAKAQKAGAVANSQFQSLMTRGPTEFGRLLRKPSLLPLRGDLIEEIIVTAKKPAAKAASRAFIRGLLGTAGGAITGVATVGAMMAEEISQQKLDEAFAELMKEPVKPKDTPVRVKQDEPIPEIIVKAKRPRKRPRFRFLPERQLIGDVFTDVMSRPAFDTPTVQDIEIKVDSPTLPEIFPDPIPKFDLRTQTQRRSERRTSPRTRTRTQPRPRALPQTLAELLPDTSPNPLQTTFAQPKTKPKTKTQPKRKRPSTRTLLTGFQPGMLTSPLPQTAPQMAGFCPPCPKPTRTVKKRNKCYKTLVKEARDPRRDKKYRWIEIDCDTGRELRGK